MFNFIKKSLIVCAICYISYYAYNNIYLKHLNDSNSSYIEKATMVLPLEMRNGINGIYKYSETLRKNPSFDKEKFLEEVKNIKSHDLINSIETINKEGKKGDIEASAKIFIKELKLESIDNEETLSYIKSNISEESFKKFINLLDSNKNNIELFVPAAKITLEKVMSDK